MTRSVPNRQLCLLLGVLLSLVTAADSTGANTALPTAPLGRVSDYAHLLTAADRQALAAQLLADEVSLRRADGHGPQLAVAIFADLGGAPIEDVAIRLAQSWKIGSKADDGVLLVVGVKEHAVRIEVGYGVEALLPDVTAARIIRSLILPSFRASNYSAGLRSGVTAVHQALSGVPVTGADGHSSLPSAARDGSAVKGIPISALIWAGVLMLLLLLLFIFGGHGVRAVLALLFFNSLFSGGRGGGGGGFGGGGGSFGGGGASGKW